MGVPPASGRGHKIVESGGGLRRRQHVSVRRHIVVMSRQTEDVVAFPLEHRFVDEPFGDVWDLVRVARGGTPLGMTSCLAQSLHCWVVDPGIRVDEDASPGLVRDDPKDRDFGPGRVGPKLCLEELLEFPNGALRSGQTEYHSSLSFKLAYVTAVATYFRGILYQSRSDFTQVEQLQQTVLYQKAQHTYKS